MNSRFEGFYDWNETFTYDAPMTMVISERSLGKTYGLLKQCIYDYLKDGVMFATLYRTDSERKEVAPFIFEKIEDDPDFKDEYLFKSNSKQAFIAKKPKEGKKPKWEQCAYHIALSMWQRDKKRGFKACKRFIFDEAIIDSLDRYHSYLPGEVEILAQIISTVARENESNESKVKPRLYCLANACNFVNSIFMYFGITELPKYGYSWYGSKTLLLHFVHPQNERSQYMKKRTTAGRILANSKIAASNFDNKFLDANDDFIASKTKNAKFYMGFVFKNKRFGVWIDRNEGLLYVNEKIVKDSRYVYSLTTSDSKINLINLKKSSRVFRDLVDLYYAGCIRYETIELRERFYQLLRMFGVC